MCNCGRTYRRPQNKAVVDQSTTASSSSGDTVNQAVVNNSSRFHRGIRRHRPTKIPS